MRKHKYQVFGSQDSVDVDILVFLDEKLPTIAECKKYEAELVDSFSSGDVKYNINFATVNDGVLDWVYKGTVDEVNNSCFYTFHLHSQLYPCQIKRTLVRDVNIKVLRSMRIILQFLSKTQLRPEVKIALKSKFSTQLNALSSFDLSDITQFDKNNTNEINVLKTMLFQTLQVNCLLNGIEVYTKSDAVQHYVGDFNRSLARTIMNRSIQYNSLNLKSVIDFYLCTLSSNFEKLTSILDQTEKTYKDDITS